MTEHSRLIGPGEKGEELEAGTEVVVPAAEYPAQDRTVFSVSDSNEHDELFMLEEQTTDERFPKARAYFSKKKRLTYELIPDHIKGEEGRRFLKIAGALTKAAVSGARARAYIIIRRKSKE